MNVIMLRSSHISVTDERNGFFFFGIIPVERRGCYGLDNENEPRA